NLLFSATFSQRVETISHEFLEFPEKIEIAPQATTADTVAQVKYYVPNVKTKIKLLEHLLQDEKIIRAMVFTRSKLNAEAVLRVLGKKFPGKVRVIHANKGQNTRINTMEEFKSGLLRVLVATDVAARGLDIGMVSHVINFDVPLIYEDYVHRIGRSGRAENEGAAMTFINPAEEFHFERIQEIIRLEVPLMEIPEAVEVSPTPFAEQQAYAKEIDNQNRKADPDFKGAFHEKKSRPKPKFQEDKARGNKHKKVKRNRNQLKSQGKRRKK
ncbi:MAG TPA: DEAD/DEAH box helicase, partial [Cyclobacteriaceae bacterium]|nr:DEAD/DEAH box helicase [Cyclobacteriaceae bacterium]